MICYVSPLYREKLAMRALLMLYYPEVQPMLKRAMRNTRCRRPNQKWRKWFAESESKYVLYEIKLELCHCLSAKGELPSHRVLGRRADNARHHFRRHRRTGGDRC